MFGGLGLIVVALLILPILGGIAAGLFFLFVPRLRFVSPYCALVPLFSISGLIAGGSGASGGVVFTLAPNANGPWTESIIHTFQGWQGDGAEPSGPMTFDAIGNLYGTTNRFFGIGGEVHSSRLAESDFMKFVTQAATAQPVNSSARTNSG